MKLKFKNTPNTNKLNKKQINNLYLLKNNNFMNNQNYVNSKKKQKNIEKFYFSLIKKDDNLKLKIIYIILFSPMFILILASIFNLNLVLISILITIIPILLILFLPFKWFDLLYYYLYKKYFYIKYTWFYNIDLIKRLYNKKISKNIDFLWNNKLSINDGLISKHFIVIKKH